MIFVDSFSRGWRVLLLAGLVVLFAARPVASQDAQQAGVSAAVRGVIQLSRLSGVVGKKLKAESQSCLVTVLNLARRAACRFCFWTSPYFPLARTAT